jgi:glycosyltransferase involved in cell wall biosynthesis
LDPLTWSGTSRSLFTALAGHDALIGAVDGVPRALAAIEKAASFSRDRRAWRQRYYAGASPLSPAVRSAMTRVAARKLYALEPEPDVLLQFGAWHDLTRERRVRPRLRASYHDGNLAVQLGRSDSVLRRDASQVRRARDFERRVYDGVDLIMPMSDWLRASFIEDFSQEPEKVVTVGAGPNFSGLPGPCQRDFTHPRLLFVGREFERKGGHQLLRAFRQVRAERPDAELWIVSTYQPGPAPGVRAFGRILRNTPEGESTISRLYREATAFVMPSLYEPFGIAFLEAMAYRLPCVGANRCAIPEIVQDGVTGLLASPDDADELAGRLLALISDPDRAREMGEAGFRRLVERYTWDRVAERTIGALRARLGAV